MAASKYNLLHSGPCTDLLLRTLAWFTCRLLHALYSKRTPTSADRQASEMICRFGVGSNQIDKWDVRFFFTRFTCDIDVPALLERNSWKRWLDNERSMLKASAFWTFFSFFFVISAFPVFYFPFCLLLRLLAFALCHFRSFCNVHLASFNSFFFSVSFLIHCIFNSTCHFLKWHPIARFNNYLLHFLIYYPNAFFTPWL